MDVNIYASYRLVCVKQETVKKIRYQHIAFGVFAIFASICIDDNELRLHVKWV